MIKIKRPVFLYPMRMAVRFASIGFDFSMGHADDQSFEKGACPGKRQSRRSPDRRDGRSAVLPVSRDEGRHR